MRATATRDRSPVVPVRGLAATLDELWRRPYVLYPLSFAFGLLVWEIIASQLPDVVFASPNAVLAHIVQATASGELPLRFAASLQHMVWAWRWRWASRCRSAS